MSRRGIERTRPGGASALVPQVEPLTVAGEPATKTQPALAQPARRRPAEPVTTRATAPTSAEPPVTSVDTSEDPDYRSSDVPDSASPEVPHSDTAELPKYLRMERRDLRLREDQIDALAALRRRIAGRRRPGERDERITDNTLVRVAIDLLLAHRDQLGGATEDQLRESALRATTRRRRA